MLVLLFLSDSIHVWWVYSITAITAAHFYVIACTYTLNYIDVASLSIFETYWFASLFITVVYSYRRDHFSGDKSAVEIPKSEFSKILRRYQYHLQFQHNHIFSSFQNRDQCHFKVLLSTYDNLIPAAFVQCKSTVFSGPFVKWDNVRSKIHYTNRIKIVRTGLLHSIKIYPMYNICDEYG